MSAATKLDFADWMALGARLNELAPEAFEHVLTKVREIVEGREAMRQIGVMANVHDRARRWSS